MMGRKAKPAHLHLLEGSKSHRSNDELEKRKQAEEDMNFKDDSVRAPTWLRKEAKKHFNKLVKEFKGSGLLKNVDVNALALYADALLDYIECTRTVEEDGFTIEQTNKAGATNSIPHPLLTKKKQAFDQMSKLMGEFGLTPAARASLARNMINETKEDDEGNKFGGRV
ncbi:phage terminase small subunit P27 family [Halobacillus sp. A5]|nr:phage terminase small subunit P27 family [Halobacillus sp. A5]MCP3026006.1 phage terminase small subunit P27 family [Halobacillus sp. A5]